MMDEFVNFVKVIGHDPGSTTKIEIDDFKILGKLGDTNSGHIAPILINFKTEEDAKLVLKGKHYLKNSINPGVNITQDLAKEECDRRRELTQSLKQKIKDFPDKCWYIKKGSVTSREVKS